MTNVREDAMRRFDEGFHCAESVLAAVAACLGIETEVIPRIATGFCGGMSRTCGTCGAVSGAVMGLSLALGRSTADEPVEGAYEAVEEFLGRFRCMHGSINCAELVGCDLGTEEGRHVFRTEHLRNRCREYTGTAAALAVELVESMRKP